MESIICVNELTKSFGRGGNQVKAVNHLSFSVAPGEAVVGEIAVAIAESTVIVVTTFSGTSSSTNQPSSMAMRSFASKRPGLLVTAPRPLARPIGKMPVHEGIIKNKKGTFKLLWQHRQIGVLS